MGWAVGWDSGTRRFRGYGVPTVCEEPTCNKEIDRGLAYSCGGLDGCGRFFCEGHLFWTEDAEEVMCERCLYNDPPFELKPESQRWLRHVLTDESWEMWRISNPKRAKKYEGELV